MPEKLKNRERKVLNFGKTEDKILNFIAKTDKLTDEERAQIKEELTGKNIEEIFRFISIAITWTSVAIPMDATINSIVGGTAIAQGAVNITHLIPTVLFSSISTALKYWFYRWHYKHLLTRWQTVKSSIPTIGPLFLINDLFKDSPVFAKALKLYIAEANPIKKFRKNISNKIKNILKRKSKSPSLEMA
jgi:hypothetical protein